MEENYKLIMSSEITGKAKQGRMLTANLTVVSMGPHCKIFSIFEIFQNKV